MTPIKTGARYGAYHRVSQLAGRDPDSESYITESVAFEKIDAWAKMHDIAIAERYLDRDHSGSKMSRPALDRMLDDLRAGVIDGIAVAQVDRLSRADVGSALAVVEEILEIAPGQLYIFDLGIDPASEFGEFGLTVLLGLARMQWRRYKRAWTDAQHRAIARGVWIGPAPFGYRATVLGHDKTGKPTSGPLQEDPTSGPIVREAFRVAAADGLHAAMAYLERTVPERRWRTDEARRLLRHRAYLGEVRLGELVNANAHRPLTTVARFNAAQTEPRGRRTNGVYPLSGIARCHCGHPMVGALQSVHGRRYRRMRCSNPTCRGGSSISADKLEGYVREQLAASLSVKRIRDSFEPRGLDEARDALEAAESERSRYARDTRFLGIVGDDAYYEGAEERARAVREASERYQAIAGQAARNEALPPADQLDHAGQFERALRAMVDHIGVRPGRGTVVDRVEIVPRVLDREDVPGALAV